MSKLTKKQKKEIVKDYLLLGSYREVAKKYGISHVAVGNIVSQNKELYDSLTLYREECIDDLKDELKGLSGVAFSIVKLCMLTLLDPEKLASAPPNQVAQVASVMMDKFLDKKQTVSLESSGVVILPQQTVLDPDDDNRNDRACPLGT